MKILNYLEKSHAIDIILAFSPFEDELPEGWKAIRGWKAVSMTLRKQGITCSDGTYRARCKELVKLGLLEERPLNVLKAHYLLTNKGINVLKILERCLSEIRDLKES